MELQDIVNPLFLQKMSIKEMEQLADQIRAFLIASVSKTGGHLSSNLGVVELTIALHRVFHSPQDKLIFDVGHQAYVHKILTGRAKDFKNLRQYKGLSGFLKKSESEHDVWEAGHSSTSLSAALGMAIARDLNDEKYHIVPIIGDGALTGGMAYEALDQIGSLKKNMMIILNDNDMSISRNVGAISKGFEQLRESRPYHSLKGEVKAILSKTKVGRSMLTGLRGVRDFFKDKIIQSSLFSDLGIEYFGPIDGHDLRKMIRIFSLAKDHEGPVVIHVVTKKGKGYRFCEEDTTGQWHGVSPFDPATGKPIKKGDTGVAWSQVITNTLVRLAKQNEELVVLTPAMMAGSKLQMFADNYPKRIFDCGIAEEHAATLAAALAQSGKRPFLSIYSSFLQRAYDQINHDICRTSSPVVIGIDRSGLVGEDGDTHHGVFDVGILRPLPNLIIAQPKDATEAQHLLFTAFKQDKPFALRYPRGSRYFAEVKQLMEIPVGSWEAYESQSGEKAFILTYGDDVDIIKTEIFHREWPVTVVNCRFFKPLAEAMLYSLAEKQLPVFVYEPDMLAGGLSSAIMEYDNDHNLGLHLLRYGIGDEYVTHGSVAQLRKHLGLDLKHFMEQVKKELG